MASHEISLSSAGLKNLVKNIPNDKEFTFIFGKQMIKVNNINAEFISPAVSRLHYSDPLIDFIDFNFKSSKNSVAFYDKFLTKNIIDLFLKLSNGDQIKINKKQVFSLQLISILIENEELLEKLNLIQAFEINVDNISEYITRLQFFALYKKTTRHFNFSQIINFLSSHFYLVDQSKLLSLPRSILCSIIRNPNLVLKNEDSLLDFINNVFSIEEKSLFAKEEVNIIDFYEAVDFSALSESRFREFISNFRPDDMTNNLWCKLSNCFYTNSAIRQKKNSSRYSNIYSLSHQNLNDLKNCQLFEYDGESDHAFKGIINYLTATTGANIDDYGIIKITCSDPCCRDHEARNLADLDNYNYFACNGGSDTWIQYDFKSLKIQPTNYSIRTSIGLNSLQNWVIEGSNSGSADDWKILDKRTGIHYLDSKNAFYTFKISNPVSQNEFYQYLRLRQIGVNSGGNYKMRISAIEFFGSFGS